MFTKLQQEIIRGVSTVLFQDVIHGLPNTRAYKRETNTHEEHQKGHYFEVGDIKYCLYVIEVDSTECLGIDEFVYDEYGRCEDVQTRGYVVLGKPDHDQWEMYRYCISLERILENGC